MKKTLKQQCLGIVDRTVSNHPQYRFFIHYSFVVKDSRLIAWGVNREGKPDPWYGYKKYGKVHAETEAYKKANSIRPGLKDFEVFNVRVNKQGELRLASPCACCIGFLQQVGCKKVYYTTSNNNVKSIRL